MEGTTTMTSDRLIDPNKNNFLAASCARCPLIVRAAASNSATLSCVELMPAIDQRPFASGDILPFNGAVPGKTVILAVGTARVEWTLDDGRRQVLGFRFRGDILARPVGGAEVQTVAVTSGILYLIDDEIFMRCRESRRDADPHGLAAARAEMADLAALALTVGRMTARERIAEFLIGLATRIGRKSDTGTAVDIAMNREDIADHLGLNAETVSRVLSRLKAERLIDMPKPGTVILREPHRLAAVSPLRADPDDVRYVNIA